MASKSVHTQLLAMGARKGLHGFWWMFKIIVPVSWATTLLDASGWMRQIEFLIEPISGRVHLPSQAAYPLLAGMLTGVSYGSAVIIQEVRETPIAKSKLTRLHLSIGVNHSMIDDPVLFLPLGLNPFWLWVPRLAFHRRFISLAGCLGAILWVLWSGSVLADQMQLPFQPGEKLTFELKWTMVPAGQATLEVKPIKQVDGKDAYHFRLTARSNRVVDVFYKVRDRIDGYADLDMTRSVFYAKRQREGQTRKNVIVRFDWDSQTAEYTEFLKRAQKGPVALLPGAFDPLSVFYYTRKQSLQVGEELQRPVTDGKKCVLGKAKILRREKITVPAGEFDTYLMVPDLKHVGGVFKKSKNAKIELWVSADERRLPVKLRSEVIVGSFTGELVKVSP